MKKENINVKEMVMTALWIAIVAVITMIYLPLPQGYINMGDAAVFLGVFLLGRKNGVIAAGLGSSLADIILGYTAYAPFTLIIKAGMAFIFGSTLKMSAGKVSSDTKKVPISRVVGVGLATIWMTTGYYFTEVILTGNKITPFVSIAWNILQGAIGGTIALLLIFALGSLRMPKGRKKEDTKNDGAPLYSMKEDISQEIEQVEAEIVSPSEINSNKEESPN